MAAAPLVALLSQAKELAGPDVGADALQGLVDELLGRLLLIEGPPVDPVAGVSADLQRTIVRSPKGRPQAVAHTWTTGPWRCLLIESPSVPMARPIFIPRNREALASKNVLTSADFRVILSSRTQRAIRRIVSACHALGIAQPIGEAAVQAVFGRDRTFLAWRPREANEPFDTSLRGDVDNFAKTILDGLQAAGVCPNDRGVFRLTAAKDLPNSWTTPALPLDDALRDEALERRGRGEDLETIRVEMRLSRAHMARFFPGEYKAPGRPKDPALGEAAARRALELIVSGTPYRQARKETDAPARALRNALAAHLRARVIGTDVSLNGLAQELQLDTRTVSAIFRGDDEALKALRSRRPTRTKAEATRALNTALRDVRQQKLSVAAAARKHGLPVASLHSKIQRSKKPKRK